MYLGETFNLYTHSYLGYGAEQAREALNKNLLTESAITSKKVSDPCLYSGNIQKKIDKMHNHSKIFHKFQPYSTFNWTNFVGMNRL
jgi:hypothetical protein